MHASPCLFVGGYGCIDCLEQIKLKLPTNFACPAELHTRRRHDEWLKFGFGHHRIICIILIIIVGRRLMVATI